MNKLDKDEIRELFNDLLNAHSERIEGKFNLINEKLERIEQQTIKTNGRVNKHDEQINELQQADIKHTINCPFASDVKELQNIEQQRKGQQKTLKIVSAVISAAVGAIVSIIGLLLKQ